MEMWYVALVGYQEIMGPNEYGTMRLWIHAIMEPSALEIMGPDQRKLGRRSSSTGSDDDGTLLLFVWEIMVPQL